MPPGFACQPYRLSVGGLAGRDISYNKHIKTGYTHLIQPTTFKGIQIMSVTKENIESNTTLDEAKVIEKFVAWAEDSRGIKKSLTQAVIDQLTVREFLDYAQNISENGISGGYNGFVFYTETVDFYEKNRVLIIEWAKDYSLSIGLESSFLTTLAQAQVFKNNDIGIDDLAELIYSQEAKEKDDYEIFCNSMSWIVAEEVCDAYMDFLYEKDSN